MNIQERLHREIARLEAAGQIEPVSVVFNWLSMDSRGRIEVWSRRPYVADTFGQWAAFGDETYQAKIIHQFSHTEKHFKLLTSQWKSCIIAINETQQKPINDAPLASLIAVAAMFDNHPDCWL